MYQLRPSTERDQARILEIWREAVDATHDFLTDVDRAAIECEVSTLFAQVNLLLAVDNSDTPQGFMFLHEGHLEALFVDPARHGQGIGKALVQRALADHPQLTTDVNEQNPKALAFYKRMGFECTGHSPCDGQGRPYPLLHLHHRSSGSPVLAARNGKTN